MENDLLKQNFPNTVKAIQPLIKLLTLANAGGIAATVTVIGATTKEGCFESILAWPLGLFSAGIIFSILYPTSLFLRIAKQEKFEPSPIKWLIHDKALRFFGYGAIFLFIIGCVASVGIVAIY